MYTYKIYTLFYNCKCLNTMVYTIPNLTVVLWAWESPAIKDDWLLLKHGSAEQFLFSDFCTQKLSHTKINGRISHNGRMPHFKKWKIWVLKSGYLSILWLIYWTICHSLNTFRANILQWSFLNGLFYLPKGVKMGSIFVSLKKLWNYFVKTSPWGLSKNNWANSMSKHNEQNI